jgi:hypothetical protein
VSELFKRKSPGANLAPVPDDCCVLRFVRPPLDFAEKGNISVAELERGFELSTDDKKSVPPHLSVWVDYLTTPEQAYKFLPENSPLKLVICLKVSEIRKIQAPSAQCIYSNLLDVIWIYIYCKVKGKSVKDRRPGAKGHSGIIGLDENSSPKELTNSQKKRLRKNLRAQLADLASQNYSQIRD